MKMKCRLLSLLLIVVLLAGCGKTTTEKPTGSSTPTTAAGEESTTPSATPSAAPTKEPEGTLESEEAKAEQAAFDAFLDEVFLDMIATQDSMSIHFMLQHPEKLGLSEELTFGDPDYDEEAFAADCKEYEQKLETFRYEYLTESQKINYDRCAYEFALGQYAVTLTPCYSGLFAQNSNMLNGLSTYFSEYPICEKKDAEQLLELLAISGQYFDAFYRQLELDKERGLYPTEYMLDTFLETAEELVDLDTHPFVVNFEENMKSVAEISDAERAQFTERARELVASVFVPALEAVCECAEDLYEFASEGEGLCSKQGGKEYFEYLLQAYIGTEMTVEESFSYLETKKNTLLKQYMNVLASDATLFDRYERAGYDTNDPEEILNRLKVEMTKYYPEINETKFTVSYLPKALEQDGILAYFLTPQLDNRSRKVIRVNGSALEDVVSLYSTLAHEGYPGHLYQDEFFGSTEGYHKINALFSYLGYQEGWACMVGAQAYDWCLADENLSVLYNFDYDFSMILAAISSIGVNYYGWSEEDVYEYLAENYIDSEEAAESFYQMAVSDPVVYLPYTLGYHLTKDVIRDIKLTGLKAKEAYEVFLTIGPAPFELIRKHAGL